jgi:hypothetical protein
LVGYVFTMEKIPVAVKIEILSYLAVNEVLKCSTLSKEFYSTCQEEGLWEILTKKQWPQYSPPENTTEWKKLYRSIDEKFPVKLSLATYAAQIQPYPILTIASSK